MLDFVAAALWLEDGGTVRRSPSKPSGGALSVHSDNSYEPNDGEPGAGKRACRRTLTRRYICFFSFSESSNVDFFFLASIAKQVKFKRSEYRHFGLNLVGPTRSSKLLHFKMR